MSNHFTGLSLGPPLPGPLQVEPPHFFGDVRHAAFVANSLDFDLFEKCGIDGQGQLVFRHDWTIRLHVLPCQ